MAASISVLVTFSSFAAYGGNPKGGLIEDANGDLFGLSESGGADGGGSVYELVNSPTGYASTPLTLFSFNGTDGYESAGALLMDANGDLFGTTGVDGPGGYGTVFELAHSSVGYASAPLTLAAFSGPNGAGPTGSLIADAHGDLFGTTYEGGANQDGTVFEIQYNGTYASTPLTLVNFGGADGASPDGSLITDAKGDLFGTTSAGGADGDGTVFEISKTAFGYAATSLVLASLNGADGNEPLGNLSTDANGDLFGTATTGGPGGDGTVFEIAKSTNTASGYASLKTLANFNGYNGGDPEGTLIADAKGDLFGTTVDGPDGTNGTIFEILKTVTGYASTTTAVADLTGYDGQSPYASLIADATGDLFGTADFGGHAGGGTLYEVTGAGFAVCYLRGTRIQTRDGERNIEHLCAGDEVITRFGGVQRIKWIGRQSFAQKFAKNNRDILPVRIACGALGNNLPVRELVISPGHSMLLDGALILAKLLVNGVTITQRDAPEEIHYYQIEFERHDCVLAEGAWSESYADCVGLRNSFHNAAEFFQLYPKIQSPAEPLLCAGRPQTGEPLAAVLRPVVARAVANIIPGRLGGYIDRIMPDGLVAGWAQDDRYPELPQLLDVMLGEEILDRVLAFEYRGDLQEAGMGTGKCGFAARLRQPLAQGAKHRISVRRCSDGAPLPLSHECSAALGLVPPVRSIRALRPAA